VAKPLAFGFSTISGLPAHVLIVHATVVLVPLTAICLLLALRPSLARRFGIALPVVGVASLVSVFAAMNAGGWLQDHVENTPLVQHHVAIAGQLWPFSAVAAILTVAVWWLSGREQAGDEARAARPAATPAGARTAGQSRVMVIVAVLSVLASIGSVVEVVRIGEAGSRASWSGHFSQQPTPHGRPPSR
jgi:hypothetical protein